MKKSTIAFGLMVASAVGAGILTVMILTRISRTETVVVSQHYIPPYTRINTADIKTVTIPRDSGIQGLSTDPSQVIGKYLTFPVPSGYPITSGDLSTSSSFSAFLTQYILKTGQTGIEMEIPIQDAIENLVNPGENIALIIPNRTGSGFQTIQPVHILNVLRASKGGSVGLMVFVSTQNYNDIVGAILNNNVKIALIPQNGTFVAPSSVTALPSFSTSQGLQIGQNQTTQGLSAANITVTSQGTTQGGH